MGIRQLLFRPKDRASSESIGGAFGPNTNVVVALESFLGSLRPKGWDRLVRAAAIDWNEAEAQAALRRIDAAVDQIGFPVTRFATSAYAWMKDSADERLAAVPDEVFLLDLPDGRQSDPWEVRDLVAGLLAEMAIGVVAMPFPGVSVDDVIAVSLPVPMQMIVKRAETISHPQLLDPFR